MSLRRIVTTLCIPVLTLVGVARTASAQENPYFITYTHHMEEPGSLEVALNPVFGVPKGGARQFVASSVEIEYGVNGWWTSELYLDSQKTSRESTLFTGYRDDGALELLDEPVEPAHRLVQIAPSGEALEETRA